MAINKAVRDGLQAEQADVADEMAQLEERLQWLKTRQDALRLILDQETTPDTGLRRLGVRDAARAVLKEAGALEACLRSRRFCAIVAISSKER